MPWLRKLRLKRLLKQFVIVSMAYMTPIQATSQNLPSKPPLKRWDLSWLTAEITRRRDERTGHVTPAPASTDDVGNVPGRLAEIIDSDDLLVKLLDAAGGNVQPGAIDTAPIAALLEQGCDVVPAVRHLLADPI